MRNEPGGEKRGPALPHSVAKVPCPTPWCGAGRGFCLGPWNFQGPAHPVVNAMENVDQIGYQKAGLLREDGLGTHWELKRICIALVCGRGYTPSHRCSGPGPKREP